MSTNAHLEALVGLLEDHTWSSTTPAAVHKGSIPDALEYPVIGVFAAGGEVVDETLGGYEVRDAVEVTIAQPVEVGGEDANQDALSAMKDELVKLVYDNPHLGIPATVTDSMFLGWDSTLAAFEDDMGDRSVFQYLTIRFSVRYVLALT